MTRAQAASIASQLTLLGFPVTVVPSQFGDITRDWIVHVPIPRDLPVTADIVANFATANGVVASIIQVDFT